MTIALFQIARGQETSELVEFSRGRSEVSIEISFRSSFGTSILPLTPQQFLTSAQRVMKMPYASVYDAQTAKPAELLRKYHDRPEKPIDVHWAVRIKDRFDVVIYEAFIDAFAREGFVDGKSVTFDVEMARWLDENLRVAFNLKNENSVEPVVKEAESGKN